MGGLVKDAHMKRGGSFGLVVANANDHVFFTLTCVVLLDFYCSPSKCYYVMLTGRLH